MFFLPEIKVFIFVRVMQDVAVIATVTARMMRMKGTEWTTMTGVSRGVVDAAEGDEVS